jgi:hypothetical protein
MDYVPQDPRPMPVPVRHSFVDRIVGAVKLSRPIFDEVRRDTGAMSQAGLLVLVTGLLSGISQYAEVRGDEIDFGDGNTYTVSDSFFGPLFGGIGFAILALIFWVLTAILFRFVAVKMLSSPETNIQWQEVARPLGFASAPSLLLLLAPIPVIGFLVVSFLWIWTTAAQIVAMSETFRVSKWRAFAIIVVAALLLSVVIGLLVCTCILGALAIF